MREPNVLDLLNRRRFIIKKDYCSNGLLGMLNWKVISDGDKAYFWPQLYYVLVTTLSQIYVNIEI